MKRSELVQRPRLRSCVVGGHRRAQSGPQRLDQRGPACGEGEQPSQLATDADDLGPFAAARKTLEPREAGVGHPRGRLEAGGVPFGQGAEHLDDRRELVGFLLGPVHSIDAR